MIRKIILVILLVCSLVQHVQSQVSIITPDPEINESVKNKSLDEIDLIRYEIIDDRIILDPRLPADWTWVAAKNISSHKGRIDFFFYNGILYTNSNYVEYSDFRIRKFPDLFTMEIESNTYVIGFQKKDKGILFVATDEPKEVYVKINRNIMGEELLFNFYLKKNEAKMFRLTRKTNPFLP